VRDTPPGGGGQSHPAAVTSPLTNPRADNSSPKVEVSADEFERLKIAAESWWTWWSSDALADLVDREVVARIRAASVDLSTTARWSVAVGPTHRRLEELRNIPAWVCRCQRPGCRKQTTVYSVEQWRAGWRCPEHPAERQAAA